MRLRLAVGDIVTWRSHVIAVSSNRTLAGNENPNYWRFSGRRGTNGAAHIAAVEPQRSVATVRCEVGQAVWTRAFGPLAERGCTHVVHTVVPDGLYVHAGSSDAHVQAMSEPLLRESFSAVMATAAEVGAESVALPALGCGVNGWRPALAALAAAHAAAAAAGDSTRAPGRVDFVMVNVAMWRRWRQVLAGSLGPPVTVEEAAGDGRTPMATWHLKASSR